MVKNKEGKKKEKEGGKGNRKRKEGGENWKGKKKGEREGGKEESKL